jgi:hypothetical protein
MKSITVLLTLAVQISASHFPNPILFATSAPTAIMDLVAMPSLQSTTFKHGTQLTSCPCYQPGKTNCGITALTRRMTSSISNCPQPTINCALPKCRVDHYTLFRERCPQVLTTTVTQTTCPQCPGNYCTPVTTTLDGIGPVEKMVPH